MASALFDQLRLKKNFSEVSAVNIAFLENDEKFNSLTSISRSVWLRCLLLFYRRNEENILNIFVKKFTFLAPGNYGRISIAKGKKKTLLGLIFHNNRGTNDEQIFALGSAVPLGSIVVFSSLFWFFCNLFCFGLVSQARLSFSVAAGICFSDYNKKKHTPDSFVHYLPCIKQQTNVSN